MNIVHNMRTYINKEYKLHKRLYFTYMRGVCDDISIWTTCMNYMWNMVRIGFMATEEMSFENTADDNRRTMNNLCLPIL